MARPNRAVAAVAGLVALALVLAACNGGDDDGNGDASNDASNDAGNDAEDAMAGPTESGPTLPSVELVFNGEGNNLNAYDPATGAQQRVITNAEDDPEGLDINAQICFFPDGSGRFVAGEDTGQPENPPGWGIFRLEGARLGELTATQVGKLVPTYQESVDDPEMYGCGFLSDGRIVTSDVGNQAEGDGDGQLIIWFPPFDAEQVAYCKLDAGVATAQQIAIDDQDRIYLASARGPGEYGILRYTGPFPTSADADGGCGRTDATGAPLADAVAKEVFIPPSDLLQAPAGVVRTPEGHFYVSSVINGVIAEYDAQGAYVRTILQPPEGEVIGEQTLSTGTPLGLGLDSAGTLYFADIGIVVTPERIGPGPEGSVQMIRFEDGDPLAPEVLAFDLEFPDGIGIFTPPA